MISIREYIVEALNSKVSQWFQKVYKSMQSLISDNKLQPVAVDAKKLNKPKKPFDFDDFANDSTVKQILADKVVGFTVTNQMIRMPQKYMVDDNGNDKKELKPTCYPYFYQQDKNVYFIGITMYDTTTSYIDQFIHLVGIETSLCVQESTPVLKAMLNDFITEINKMNKGYVGISAKPLHPKMKAILIKLGFSVFKDNKDILTYKL